MHGPATQQMQMDVKHILTTLFIAVPDQSVATFRQPLLIGQFGGGQHHMTDQVSIVAVEVIKRCDVVFGNDQYVAWRLWTDVVKGEEPIVFIGDVCRNLSGDDFAEYAVHPEPP